MDRPIVTSMETEFRRYKEIAEGALDQITDEELGGRGAGGTLSTATLVWHIAGNLTSRFTDFLESDGEKPWRNRESEFLDRTVTRKALLIRWEEGWTTLFNTLGGLQDEDLAGTVRIRGESLPVHQALVRALAHIAYHIGQIVDRGRGLRGGHWQFLSIPPGRSEEWIAGDPVEPHGTPESG